ncbi:MAG: TIGR04282 family arsenosugar biosynthesis glycosyltransferase, partial [bacterium]
DDGAKRTVIIGTDVPELSASIIESAFHQLNDHDVVLGPSTDGGYYLLGMKPPVKEVFDGIEWSSEKVYAQTVKCLQTSRLSYARLPEFADVDTEEDYRQYLARTKSP